MDPERDFGQIPAVFNSIALAATRLRLICISMEAHIRNSMYKSCPNHVQILSRSWPHVQVMSKSCPNIVHMLKSCPDHVQILSICSNHVRIMSKSCPSLVHMLKSCPNLIRMLKSCSYHVQITDMIRKGRPKKSSFLY